MPRRRKTIFTLILMLLFGLTVASCALLRHKQFGAAPEGERLRRIQASPNYAFGEFGNTVPTPMLAEGQSTLKILVHGLFTRSERLRPTAPLPTVRTALTGPDAPGQDEDMVLWLGHSSFYIQLGGRRILVDPVFNDHGSPLPFLNRTFPGTDIYTPADMPEIDVLLISHDHWDHLDYKTVAALRDKVGSVVCPLGVGADFALWGYPASRIHERDWWETGIRFDGGPTITVVPARHYSGRLFDRNKTLWAGFVIETPRTRLLLSGDSGYGPHFAQIARRFGPFDLVALDGGQYDARWPLIHMTPEEAARAAEDLGAGALLLAHAGRFCISEHPWDEPFMRMAEASAGRSFRLLTPKIGQPVRPGDAGQRFDRWWEGLD